MNKSSSYLSLTSIYSVLLGFFTVPISRDANAMQRLVQQLVEPLQDVAVGSTVEFSCERHGLECHFKRLKLLCKLHFVGSNIAFDCHAGSKKALRPPNPYLRAPDRKRILDVFTPE
jgi:hypothetical protein